MTPLQLRVLEMIEDYIIEKDYPPTYEEIGRACKIRSKSGVHRVVHGLEARGLIRRSRRYRSIEVVPPDEVTPAMIRAGGMALMDGLPDEWRENPGVVAERVFKAMLTARTS